MFYVLLAPVANSSDWKDAYNIEKVTKAKVEKLEKIKKFIEANNKCDLAISDSYPKTPFQFWTWKPNIVICFKDMDIEAGTVNYKHGCTFAEYDADTNEYSPALSRFGGGGAFIPMIENSKCTKESMTKLFATDSSGAGRLPPKQYMSIGDIATQYAEHYESKLVYARSKDLQELWEIKFKSSREKSEKRIQEERMRDAQSKKEREERLKIESEKQQKKKELKKKIKEKKKQEEESLYE